jgi:hypothetical protein
MAPAKAPMPPAAIRPTGPSFSSADPNRPTRATPLSITFRRVLSKMLSSAAPIPSEAFLYFLWMPSALSFAAFKAFSWALSILRMSMSSS